MQNSLLQVVWTRAGRYIECDDDQEHLVSKAGSVISNKYPSPAFKYFIVFKGI